LAEHESVADTDKALREDMQQKTAQELVGLEFHDFLAIAVPIVFIEEAHVIAVEADHP
jgi:hypothetical protein